MMLLANSFQKLRCRIRYITAPKQSEMTAQRPPIIGSIVSSSWVSILMRSTELVEKLQVKLWVTWTRGAWKIKMSFLW